MCIYLKNGTNILFLFLSLWFVSVLANEQAVFPGLSAGETDIIA